MSQERIKKLTIISPQGQPREDGTAKGAQTGVMDVTGVVERGWCAVEEDDHSVRSRNILNISSSLLPINSNLINDDYILIHD